MGCCSSLFTFQNDDLQDDETVPLLSQDDQIIDEESEIQLILSEFSSNLINTESMTSNGLSELEVEQLSNLYEEKLKNLEIVIPNTSTCLLKDVQTPEAIEILSSDPISLEDKQLINRMLKDAVAALNSMKIEKTEDFVVSFPN